MPATNGNNVMAAVTSVDVNALRRLLSGTGAGVYAPSDDRYRDSIERWSRAAEKPAGVAVVPSSAEEVAIAVRYAAEQGLDLAVKGGGHSTAGASSTDGGLLIDLSRMRRVTVDAPHHRLFVQGGALWSDVDDAAWKHGLATVGGTVADTGVGGLSLGGGYGVLSGLYGLVIDNMISATVVLANGEIKTASRDENAELLWALQGAGQNFGVTTEFVLQAFPQKNLFMGTMLFPPTPDVITSLLSFVNESYETRGSSSKAQGKATMLLALAKPPPLGGQTMLLVAATYRQAHTKSRCRTMLILAAVDGNETEGRKFYKPLLDLQPVADDMRMGSYPDANKLIPAAPGMRSSMKGAAFVLPIREKFLNDMLGFFEHFHADCSDAAASIVAWELFDTSKVVQSEVGSFANRGFHLNGLIMPLWNGEENDQKCRQWAREMSLRFKQELETQGEAASKGLEGGASLRGQKGAVMLYGNYDQYDEISKDIFGDNYNRLQKIKAKYDPKNVFNKLFPILPLA